MRAFVALAGTTCLMALALSAPAAAQSTASPFTSATRYDLMGRVTGMIAPDPNPASGSPQYAAVRNSYDAGGRLVLVEQGVLTVWQSDSVAPANWTNFTVYQSKAIAYNQFDQKVNETLLSSDGTKYAHTQYSYDALHRLECTAVRMNQAYFHADQSTACQFQTQGSDGPDRITHNIYDIAGQLLKVQKAFGVTTANGFPQTLQQDYATYTYTTNGKMASMVDANGNKATMTYDAYDRQVQWNFPDKVTAGSVSTTDYEAYTYDVNGNRLTLRKRDGSVISYNYDALNRVLQKRDPDPASGPVATATANCYTFTSDTNDVCYSYDLRGLQLTAKFGYAGGPGLANSYDGFGRLATASTNMDGTARAFNYSYNADGGRTDITHPDGQYFHYVYDNLDRVTAIQENGASQIAAVAYDPIGRRTGITRGAVTTGYTYDPVSRLATLADNLSGTTNDVARTFGYNPASQLTSYSRDNDLYAFTGYAAASKSYAVNGLNQYTTADGATLAYDANGNLTSNGGTTYSYDAENRLIAASSGTTLDYDPAGRLWRMTTGTAQVRFVYDGDQLTSEYDGNGALVRRYVHGNDDDDPLLWYEGSTLADRRSLGTDTQGSIVSVANADGTLRTINSYDEYGVPAAGNDGRFQYTGQAYLPALGFYYYKARMYSSRLGRFMQTDPIGYKDQNNLYTYAGNDPIDGRDPSGLYEKDVHYYLTEVLSEAAGISPEVSQKIAAGDQGVDDNPATSPMGMSPIGSAVQVRADYHFTTEARRDQMYSQFSKSGKPGDLGQFLHAKQDSYSHAGYGPRFGHLSAGTAPDKTYLDVGKADLMARSTYDTLVAARGRLGQSGSVVPYSAIAGVIHAFDAASTSLEKSRQLSQLREIIKSF